MSTMSRSLHDARVAELSFEQHELALSALEVRDRIAHGFQAAELADSAPRLLGLVRELLGEWAPGRRAA